jgi:hypothetical protein
MQRHSLHTRDAHVRRGRRQYLAYLQSVQEDVIVSERKVRSVRERLTRELGDLKQLVENKASVPKVYTALYHAITRISVGVSV